MKILSAQQMREADQYTIANEPIASIDLMERASKAFFDAIKPRLKKNNPIHVFCGMGNNGGDGLAIARMLIHAGYKAQVYKVLHSDKASEDFIINEKRLTKMRRAQYAELSETDILPSLSSADVVIDALFGSGLNRPLEGFAARLVQHINKSGARVLAVDLPSGLFADDNTSNKPEHIIKADYTFTFQLPKLSFLFPENEFFVGNWQVLDIGLDKSFIDQQPSDLHFLQPEELSTLFHSRSRFSHKGNFGHALLFAGSLGKAGAAVLAGKACLRMGAGLLTVHVPACNYSILQSTLPEAMVSVDSEQHFVSETGDISPYSAIGTGPGLGRKPQTANALKLLIQNSRCPMVLDADALNILAENPTWLSFLPAGSILTPHVKEFERLTGKSANGWERLQKAREFAFRYGCYVVLKGAFSAVVGPDKKVVFNSTGNPGLATGGTGDVLTGMILGLLAQGYTPRFSAMAGVLLHGLAADLAVRRIPMESLMAGDVVSFIDRALKKVII